MVIKKLEWNMERWEKASGPATASTPFGDYEAWQLSECDKGYWLAPNNQVYRQAGKSIHDAMEAAQADFESKIQSCEDGKEGNR